MMGACHFPIVVNLCRICVVTFKKSMAQPQ